MSATKGNTKAPGEGGTILLRQAKPKYGFQGRKLPQETSVSKDLAASTKSGGLQNKDLTSNTSSTKTVSMGGKPVAVVGASYQGSQSPLDNDMKTASSNLSGATTTSVSDPLHVAASMPNLASTLPSPQTNSRTLTPRITSGNLSAAQNFKSQPNLLDNENISKESENGSPFAPEDQALVELTAASAIASQVIQGAQKHKEHIERLERERDQTKQDLEVQLQVNAELKKLLVASVGEDLSQRVERLARDRAQLSMDLGGFSKKMSEDYENFDKVSIQADMWRSKYLASRVMVEELANARAYYSLQCHDSHDALQQLLNERHELRTNLVEAYKVLQQVKNAFDPLNSHCSSTLASTNVLHLTRACQQLAEAVRFRLLPSHIAVPIGTELTDEMWENSVTRAEQFAHEVLSRPVEPTGSLQSGSSSLLPLTSSPGRPISRFHPNTRHENLTFNCCDKCKGEIKVL